MMDEEASVGEVRLNQFVISEFDDKSVWISTNEGEGGQFGKAEFEKAVAEFYKENF